MMVKRGTKLDMALGAMLLENTPAPAAVSMQLGSIALWLLLDVKMHTRSGWAVQAFCWVIDQPILLRRYCISTAVMY